MSKIKLNHNLKKWLFPLIRVSFALVIAVSICQFNLDNLEFFTFDIRTQLKPTSPTSGKFTLVSYDQSTIDQIGGEPDANLQMQLLEGLMASNPMAVIWVLPEDQFKGSYTDKMNLAKFARDNNVYYAVNDLVINDNEADLRKKPPYDIVPILAAPITRDTHIFAKDRVTRRIMVSFQGAETGYLKVARDIMGGDISSETLKGKFEFLDSQQALIDFRPRGTYPRLPVENILSGQYDREQIEGKVVVIGRDTLNTSEFYVRTPYSKDLNAMTAMELYANSFDTVYLNRAPIMTPKAVDIILTCLVSLLTVLVVLRARPARGLVVLGVTLASILLVSFISMWGFQFVLGLAHPLLAIFFCYYFFIPYRLIVENKRSWEYYHKNKLLTQVEELKSNFLKMMSHDLKTPLARIQGMTDLVLRDSEKLNNNQVEAVKTISESSEQLTEFIGSILNLNRIESKEIKLQFKSKDVNALLDEAIKKCEYNASKKDIEIIKEFEPMFSIPLDEDLMRQVFTNLVENAVKYSPEGSKILVSTEEIDGKVMIQVADQGIGIEESEIENVFTKFYRCKSVTGGNIQGSGLGLYLAKYFVDLHDGNIKVESQMKKGSTFSVQLPMSSEV